MFGYIGIMRHKKMNKTIRRQIFPKLKNGQETSLLVFACKTASRSIQKIVTDGKKKMLSAF